MAHMKQKHAHLFAMVPRRAQPPWKPPYKPCMTGSVYPSHVAEFYKQSPEEWKDRKSDETRDKYCRAKRFIIITFSS